MITWCIQGLLLFHINFRIIFSPIMKHVLGILIGIALNLFIALGSTDILTVLILLMQVHKIYFHFLNHFQFPLSIFYSFQHIHLSPPCLSLFLGIFYVILNRRVFFLLSLYDIMIFIISVKKCSRFLYANFVSCYLSQLIY